MTMQVRVMVTEPWDRVTLAATPDQPVGVVKREALARTLVGGVDPDGFVVKFRGGLVQDEQRTLAELEVPNDAMLIVLPARRRPVR